MNISLEPIASCFTKRLRFLTVHKIERLDGSDQPQPSLCILDTCSALLGLPTCGSRGNSILNRIQKMSLTIFILLSFSAVFLHLYLISKSGLSSINFARIIYNLVTLKLLFDANCYGHKLDDLLRSLLAQLGSKLARRIRWRQILPISFILVSSIVSDLNLLRCFITASKSLFELEVFLHGSSNVGGNNILITLSYLNLEFLILVSANSYFYYIIVQALLKHFGCKCEEEFPLLAQAGNVSSIIKKCQFFNRVRIVSNEVMSFTPFHSFFMKWMFFVFGVTTAINNKEKFTNYSAIVSFMAIILTTSMLLVWTVFTVYRADCSMDNARRTVGELINLNPANFVSQSQSIRWNAYFNQNPLVRAMVWHFFEVHPNLVLVSFNSMITFSVMVLTTASAFLK